MDDEQLEHMTNRGLWLSCNKVAAGWESAPPRKFHNGRPEGPEPDPPSYIPSSPVPGSPEIRARPLCHQRAQASDFEPQRAPPFFVGGGSTQARPQTDFPYRCDL